MFRSLRHKLLIGFLALGVLPVALVSFYANQTNNGSLVQSAGNTLQAHADALMDKIDRNLFERYGDVQAFAFHPKARGTPEQVREAADFYTKAYVIYDLMLVCDLDGRILATNTIGYDGKPIDTSAIVGQSVAGQDWFERIKSGSVKAGETLYDSPPENDELVTAAYGEKRTTLAYSAPIFDDQGHVVRIWSNRVSWERVVGQIMSEFLEQQNGEHGAATITAHVVSHDGHVLHGAATGDGSLDSDAGHAITAGKTGYVEELDAESGVNLVSGFSASNGALGFSGYQWGVVLSQNRDDVLRAGGGLAQILVIAGLVTLVVVTLVGLAMATRITRPILSVEGGLSRMAAGDFTATIPVTSNDELGRMATSYNTAVEGMRAALTEVQTSASGFVSASNELTTSSTHMSDGSQQQASALEETAASLEEITGTIKQNADSARQASQLAAASREIADKGGKVVAEAVLSIKEISKSSEKIANIITTIDEIAFQTNLLALNAAVEAARAGEQGRGFAVVASEVRNLAQRSASSAKEIKGLIEESLQKVSIGSELVDKSGQSLHEIVSSVKRVTEIISEIAAASQEQATGVDQVNRAVTQMDQVVQANAGQASELAQTAQSLSERAAELQSLVGRFQLGASAPAQHEPTYTGGGHVQPASPLPRAASQRHAPQRAHAFAHAQSANADDGFIEL